MKPNYSIRELTQDEFKPLFDSHEKSIFSHMHSYDLADILPAADLNKIEDLRTLMKNQYRLFLGVFDEYDKFVGWSWGFQENSETFNMVNSAILEQHRRQGLYSALLARCIEILNEKGFQIIYSRHNATYNAIMIPKLKAGFIISKMEMSDKFGLLVHLHYYTNSDRRKIMEFRAGHRRADEKIKSVLKL